jgi:hypothetical protein
MTIPESSRSKTDETRDPPAPNLLLVEHPEDGSRCEREDPAATVVAET